MKAIFVEGSEEKAAPKLTFRDVRIDSYFVNNNGWLCQKYGERSYNVLAHSDGTPTAERIDVVDPDDERIVARILPRVDRIEF